MSGELKKLTFKVSDKKSFCVCSKPIKEKIPSQLRRCRTLVVRLWLLRGQVDQTGVAHGPLRGGPRGGERDGRRGGGASPVLSEPWVLQRLPGDTRAASVVEELHPNWSSEVADFV